MSEIIGTRADAYPSPVAGNGQMVLLHVLVKRIEGTYKVYTGIVPDNSIADPQYLNSREWVKAHGAPMRWNKAIEMFDIKKGEYAA